MALSVIGAGLGRTGTMSLKLALEQLGQGPTHHMFEVIRNPPHALFWASAFDGEKVDWDEGLKGFGSSCDWPSAHFWKQMSEHWPNAKVVLTVRDAEKWFASTQETIFQGEGPAAIPIPPVATMMRKMIAAAGLEGRLHDRDGAIAVFEAHNARVRATCPPERLLVYEVSQGWEPLCAHLGVPVPDAPFPRANSTEEFKARREAIRAGITPTH
jgi:hypothetical protein